MPGPAARRGGISYEINRFAGRYDNLLTKVLRTGYVAVKLTTRAGRLHAGSGNRCLTRVIPDEEGLDRW